MAIDSLVLHTAFLFWPVTSLEERAGWLCGKYDSLWTLPHRTLLEKGRLERRHHGRRLKGEHAAEVEITDSEVAVSFLWHENLGAALEAQRVLFETHELDAQRYCEPRALVHGERAEAAFLEFINLESGNTDQAMRFIQEFGEFDHLDLDSNDRARPGLVPREVQQFCDECLNPKDPRKRGNPFAVPLRQIWKVQADILGLWKFWNSLSEKKINVIQKECRSRRPSFEFAGDVDWLAVGKAILCADLSASLHTSNQKPPRLLLHERDGKFIALTFSRTVQCALYVQLLSITVSANNYRECLHCQRYFIPTVESQRYCTAKCQNVAKVRRSREKKSRPLKLKRAKVVNRKTS